MRVFYLTLPPHLLPASWVVLGTPPPESRVHPFVVACTRFNPTACPDGRYRVVRSIIFRPKACFDGRFRGVYHFRIRAESRVHSFVVACTRFNPKACPDGRYRVGRSISFRPKDCLPAGTAVFTTFVRPSVRVLRRFFTVCV